MKDNGRKRGSKFGDQQRENMRGIYILESGPTCLFQDCATAHSETNHRWARNVWDGNKCVRPGVGN